MELFDKILQLFSFPKKQEERNTSTKQKHREKKTRKKRKEKKFFIFRLDDYRHKLQLRHTDPD